MKRFTVVVALLLVAACASSGHDDEPRSPARSFDDGAADRAAIGVGMMLPPADWWRQAEIADAVRPSNEQVAALDKLQSEQGDDIARLQRDLGVAERDFQRVLASEKPSSDDILTAGNRLRTMHDDIFGRQIRYLAAQRALLSREQWSALEDAMRAQRRDRRREGGYGGRGSRGGYPGRGGRRPGGWGW